MFGLVAALTLVSASGCSVASQPRELDPNVDAAFAKFYTQPIDWNRCDGFDCAEVMVPMNWSDPEGEVITISVIRSKATGAKPIGDLLLNPGGPGASGVDFVRDNLEYIGTEALRANYNLIGFDPRGTGTSSPVTCLDDAGLDGQGVTGHPHPPPRPSGGAAKLGVFFKHHDPQAQMRSGHCRRQGPRARAHHQEVAVVRFKLKFG